MDLEKTEPGPVARAAGAGCAAVAIGAALALGALVITWAVTTAARLVGG